jgi:hypothetical protein
MSGAELSHTSDDVSAKEKSPGPSAVPANDTHAATSGPDDDNRPTDASKSSARRASVELLGSSTAANGSASDGGKTSDLARALRTDTGARVDALATRGGVVGTVSLPGRRGNPVSGHGRKSLCVCFEKKQKHHHGGDHI